MKVQKTVTSIIDVDLAFEDISLLSVEEADLIPQSIRAIECGSWLRSPSKISGFAAYVHGSGYVDEFGFDIGSSGGVRPALLVPNLKSSNLQIGDKIEVVGFPFTVVSESILLCDIVPFRSEFGKTNDYETSIVKESLYKWAKDVGIDFEGVSKEHEL